MSQQSRVVLHLTSSEPDFDECMVAEPTRDGLVLLAAGGAEIYMERSTAKRISELLVDALMVEK